VARSVLDLLLDMQLLDDRQHETVLSRAPSASGGHLLQTACELGYATESSLARAISAELGLARADLAGVVPEPEALALIDANTCRDRFVLPLELQEGGALLSIAMADPTDADTIGLLGRKALRRVRPLVAGPTELLRAVARAYPASGSGAGAGRPGAAASPASPKAAAGRSARGAEAAGEDTPSPLARIAAALGVRVPQLIARPKIAAAVDSAGGERSRGVAAKAGTPAGAADADREAVAGDMVDDLSPEDLETLEALGASLNKGSLVLRAIADLCVEKGLLTKDEAGRKS
jgi:Type II secretion system (T2SS), protein E, N-terminal domain